MTVVSGMWFSLELAKESEDHSPGWWIIIAGDWLGSVTGASSRTFGHQPQKTHHFDHTMKSSSFYSDCELPEMLWQSLLKKYAKRQLKWWYTEKRKRERKKHKKNKKNVIIKMLESHCINFTLCICLSSWVFFFLAFSWFDIIMGLWCLISMGCLNQKLNLKLRKNNNWKQRNGKFVWYINAIYSWHRANRMKWEKNNFFLPFKALAPDGIFWLPFYLLCFI